MLRIWRSPSSAFGVFRDFKNENEFQYESFTAVDAYTEDELQKIADSGFNSIWVHGRLDHLTSTADFPEFGRHKDEHCARLRTLIARAAIYGIKVILYLQPPRAVYCDDHEFWRKHADVGGEVTEILDGRNNSFLMRSLCTSHPDVRRYLQEAFANLVAALPELGGLLIISASEYPAHCYSRRNCRPNESRQYDAALEQVPVSCPVCSKLTPEVVILSLLHDIRDGVRIVSADLPIMFWDWCWSMYLVPAAEAIVSGMPDDCILVSDFERGGHKAVLGHAEHVIDEYSLSYAGPSEAFLNKLRLAGKRGIKVIPKLQIGTTHELATVVSLPLIRNICEKAGFMREKHIDSYLGCWNFGSQLSANTMAFNFFLEAKEFTGVELMLNAFCQKFFPDAEDEKVIKAWEYFSMAMDCYPFCIHFLYFSPLNYTLALLFQPGPLSQGKVGRSWLPDRRGDDLADSIRDFSLEEIISGLEQVAKLWSEGVRMLRRGLLHCSSGLAFKELNNAALCECIFKSAINSYKFYKLKKSWREPESLNEFRRLLSSELEIVKEALPLTVNDLRQGFHVEGHVYMFNEALLNEKLKKGLELLT